MSIGYSGLRPQGGRAKKRKLADEQEKEEPTISLILCQVLMSDNVKEEKHPGVDACWAIVVPDINQILPRYVLHLKQKK